MQARSGTRYGMTPGVYVSEQYLDAGLRGLPLDVDEVS